MSCSARLGPHSVRNKKKHLNPFIDIKRRGLGFWWSQGNLRKGINFSIVCLFSLICHWGKVRNYLGLAAAVCLYVRQVVGENNKKTLYSIKSSVLQLITVYTSVS